MLTILQIRRVSISESNIETAKISADATEEELANIPPLLEASVFDKRNEQEREERSWKCQPGSNLDATWLYLNDLGSSKLLTGAEEKYYGRLVRKGNESARHRMIESSLRKWLDRLGEKHREVTCRRYGLRGYGKATLVEVAKELGVIRERIRQIQMDALRKLRDIFEKDGFSCNAIFH